MTTPGTSNKSLGLTFLCLIIPLLKKKHGLRNVGLRFVFGRFNFKYMIEKMVGGQLSPDFASSFPFVKERFISERQYQEKKGERVAVGHIEY